MLRAALVLSLVACGGSKAPPPAPPSAPPPAPAPVVKAPSFSGIWLGTLQAGPKKLRVQIHLDLAATPPTCALDSLDQGAQGIPCDHVVVASGTALSLEVPAVHGSLTGTLSDDGNTLIATWLQGAPMPIVLTRQAAAIAIDTAKPPGFDPAMDPVDIDKIQAVTDADIAKLAASSFAPSTGVGVAIGVVSHGTRKIFSYGAVAPDAVFEIGSVTKTFTGLALAQLVEQKKVRFDEPVRALLPKGTVAAPASGAEITLLDLSAQRSGLPRMPDNFTPADPANPYADYDTKALYAYMSAHGVAMPAAPVFGYSNLGVGLLGHALSVRAGMTYEALIKKEITEPLAMRDTVITLSPALSRRLAAGHAGDRPQGPWDLNALAGAGAIRSTAADMLTYLEAQLHPDHVKGKTAEAKTLPTALAASHEVRGESLPGMHIALNWLRIDETGSYWHNGATGGYNAFALFDPAKDVAVVVLCNHSAETGFADSIGRHIAQRLLGRPAVTLAPSP